MSTAAPDLSHYYGRRVIAINPSDDGGWAIVLEGKVVVENYDESLPMPGDHLINQVFTNCTLHPRVTSMFFGGLGGNTVSLNPMKYAIRDGSMPELGAYYPQVSEAQSTWQPPPEVEIDGA